MFEDERDEIILEFLHKLDSLVDDTLNHDIEYQTIAGTMQAYITHLYTLRDDPDLEGLEHLLITALESIQNRPKWEI